MPTCKNCQKEFTITDQDRQFYNKIDVPEPTWCPDCRMTRRFQWRNERSLYKRKCDFTGKEIFSMFPVNSPWKVSSRDYWYSDKWEGLDYGKEYNFSIPFFVQFKELLQQIPMYCLSVINMENSDYCMNCGFMKDCYLVFSAIHDEGCYYGTWVEYSRDCVDCFLINNCELCYYAVNCQDCYQCQYASDCRSCHDIFFGKNLRGCASCLGCVNLNNKKYCIFNKQYDEKSYKEEFLKFKLDTYQGIVNFKNKFENFKLEYPVRYMLENKSQDSSGDYIYRSKKVRDSFYVLDAEDCSYCQFLTTPRSSDCYDYTSWGEDSALIYESVSVGGNCYNIKFCGELFPDCQNLEYCAFCTACKNCFGCAGLKNKEHCILNKQYGPREYAELVKKIKEQMMSLPYKDERGREYGYGEFFPQDMALYAYNESSATYFLKSLTKDEAIKSGYRWSEPEDKKYSVTILANDLPQTIGEAGEKYGEVIECSHGGDCNHSCTKAFKIIPQELAFYKRLNIPLPRLCFNCRFYDLLAEVNKFKLHHRQCMCEQAGHKHQGRCPVEFETTYAPDRLEKVYCEDCYQKEIY